MCSSDLSAPSLPSARSAHGLADNGTGVILFGGQGASGRLQDTWNWDGANWTALTPSTLPPSRSGHALSYDSLRRRTMLFGGLDASGAGLDDTWLWNGADWAPANPPNRPAARSGHTLAFDSVRGRTILFGGLFAFTALALDDTWEWDGAQWISFTPSQLPPGRTGHALAFDAARGRTVLFGGSTVAPASVLGDTWEWNGTSWLHVSPTAAPDARSGHTLSFDPVRARTILFGGSDAASVLRSDTWEWDGQTWAQNTANGPAARAWADVTYDPTRRRSVLFGGAGNTGNLGDTWEYGAVNGSDVRPFGEIGRAHV